MAEGARLESVYTAMYRGFESLTLRHNQHLNPPRRVFLCLKPAKHCCIAFHLLLRSSAYRFGLSKNVHSTSISGTFIRCAVDARAGAVFKNASYRQGILGQGDSPSK